MNLEEIRQGNFIEVSFAPFDYLPSRIIKVSDIEECTSASIGFEDSWMVETLPYSLAKDASSIELDVVWKELLQANFSYPPWIKHVHEIQNWYYWTNGKKELDISRVPTERGEDNMDHNRFWELQDMILSERRRLTEPDMFGYEGVDLEMPYILK